MIRNVSVKKILIKTIFPIFSIFNKRIPKDDRKILIHCSNGCLNDNSEAIYNFLIENNLYKKYKIIVDGDSKTSKYRKEHRKIVSFVNSIVGLFEYMNAKYVFYCSGKIPIKPTEKQKVINLTHGIPIKSVGQLSKINNGEEFFFTYVCATSEFYRPIMAKAFGCPEENICICGEPKTDNLFIQKEIRSYKLIVWAPTFRQSKYYGYDDSSQISFLPFIEDSEWEELNADLEKRNVRVIAKLHPGQDLRGFTKKIYSNFEIYGEQSFREEFTWNLYELLSQSDALISDYSSVAMEYLVLDRPIGFALSDLEDYKSKRGFVFDDPLTYMPGKKIYSRKELIEYIDDVANGRDEFKGKRAKINNLVNYYKEGHNCERILQIVGIECSQRNMEYGCEHKS